MARSSDAAAAVTMALLGVVLLVLWRNGTLRRLVTPAQERMSDIANRGAAPRMTAVDVLPNAGGAPHLAANASRAAAPGGVPTNGFTPSGPVMGSAPLFMRIDDPVVAPNKASETVTSLVTAIPDAFQERLNPWAAGGTLDESTRARRFGPAMLGGGGRQDGGGGGDAMVMP